jgi:hypothetical protein
MPRSLSEQTASMHDMNRLSHSLQDALVVLAANAASVANVCDHVEHKEDVSMQSVREAAREVRGIGVRLAIQAGHERLSGIS